MSNELEVNDVDNLVSESRKDYLLNQDKFELLMKAQREIEEQTEMRPTFKKLINALVTEESLKKVTDEILEVMG
jgi:hypothetical protein